MKNEMIAEPVKGSGKYKQTDIGLIPEDWEIKRLFEIADFRNGKAHEQFIVEDGNYKVVNSKFISTDGVVYKQSKVSIEPLHEGEIAMVMSDIPNGKALAKCFLVDKANSYTLNQRICAIRANEVNSNFLFRVLNRNKYYLDFDSGSGQTNLRKQDVLNCPLPIPKAYTEQTAIAEALSDADAMIASLEKLIEKKKKIKQGAMQELLRPKEGWVKRKLGEVATIYQPQTISQEQFSIDGYLVYGANGIVGRYSKYNHKEWQVTITCRGSTCGTVNKTENECWITGNAMVINVEGNPNIYKPFLFYLLLKQDFSTCITGSGQPQIVRSPLFEFPVLLPDVVEQKYIAFLLNDMDTVIKNIEIKLHKYYSIKQGMMQNLLTGKIRLV